jgi:hypothetical protein
VTLWQTVESYPHLARALGCDWADRHEDVDASKSRHDVLRWLRSPTAGQLLIALDQALGFLGSVPKIAQWRQRLAGDIDGVWGTLVEILFAARLTKCGYLYDVPEEGADFVIYLSNGERLHLELTAPEARVRLNGLHERLSAVGRRTGFQGRMTHSLEGSKPPTPAEMDRIVASESAELSRIASDSRSTAVISPHPKFGLHIEWTRHEAPRFKTLFHETGASPEMGAGLLISAIDSKRKQLARYEGTSHAVGLLVAANKMSSAIDAFFDYVELGPYQFPWTLGEENIRTAPDHLKYLIPFEVSFAGIGPAGRSEILINPNAVAPEPSGFDQFVGRVFRGEEPQGISGEVDTRSLSVLAF